MEAEPRGAIPLVFFASVKFCFYSKTHKNKNPMKHKPFNHASLFSGIGGFDLAAQWMGWNNIFNCEINPFAKKILKYYWPAAEQFDDIKQTSFKKYANKIDILTGGFPCQPFSQAGKRLGKNDERHLWPDMCRAISEIKPTYIVGENVYGIVNWNGGMVFQEVCVELENMGYEVQPLLLPACSVDAPHRRMRTFFIAYNKNFRCQRLQSEVNRWTEYKQKRNKIRFISQSNGEEQYATNTTMRRFQKSEISRIIREKLVKAKIKRCKITGQFESNGKIVNVANTNLSGCRKKYKKYKGKSSKQSHLCNIQLYRSPFNTIGIRWAPVNFHNDTFNKSPKKECREKQFVGADSTQPGWERFPSQSPICSRNDGISIGLDNITFSKWRRESLIGYGNAVVPQLILQIFKTIEKINAQH